MSKRYRVSTTVILVTVTAALIAIAGVCARAASDPNQGWVEVRSPHFTVCSNAGEKEGRRVANQFEEIRNVFQTGFPSVRLDFGKPFIILAVKNEDALKVLLPDYYSDKDRARLAGMYVPRFDRNFAVLRTDVTGTGENEYHSLYHEYTHGILRLNFATLPTWLDEGLAEFYGNTVISSGEIGVGQISRRLLTALQRSPLIPIPQLMNVDSRSPLYNERDRASIFYAESWALVHYLLTDPGARKEQLLTRFMEAWSTTNDSEEAARRGFGDLRKLGETLQAYTRQYSFRYMQLKPQERFSEKNYTARPLQRAEALAVQADFLLHAGHGREAKSMLMDAIQELPALAVAHSSLGLYDYQQHDNEAAEKEFEQALQLDSGDFRSWYYLAEIQYRHSGYGDQSTPVILKDLQKAEAINQEFAPVHAFLSVAYRQQKDTRNKALAEGMQAAKLDPTSFAYVADVGDALIALDRDAEAQAIGQKMTKNARTPSEKTIAENFNKRLTRHVERKTKPGATPEAALAEKTTNNAEPDESEAPAEKASGSDSESKRKGGTEDGLIREVHCDDLSGATVRFAILGDTLLLTAPELKKIAYHANGKESTIAANPCPAWTNRKARITYKPVADGKFAGEIVSIEFQ